MKRALQVLCLTIAGLVSLVIWSMFTLGIQNRRTVNLYGCVRNLTGVSKALQLYSESNNDRMPACASWYSDISDGSYLTSKPTCTQKRSAWSYALSSKFSGARLSEFVDQSRHPILSETDLDQPNGCFESISEIAWYRHGGRVAALLNDMSVKPISINDVR